MLGESEICAVWISRAAMPRFFSASINLRIWLLSAASAAVAVAAVAETPR